MISKEQLMQEALAARGKAYVPYSHFQVGAALATRDGKVYHGCNVENASFGLTNCAERTALFSAIADGQRTEDFVALAVCGDTAQPISPCGACRHVMLELAGPALPLFLANLAGSVSETTPAQLLPGAFTARDLE